MKKIKDATIFAREILGDFLEAGYPPGESFWSVREIARRYRCSEYAAAKAINQLAAEGYVETRPHCGCFLKENVSLDLLTGTAPTPHPAFVWPIWGHDFPKTTVTEFVPLFDKACFHRNWPRSFFNELVVWGETSLPLQLKAAQCNVLLAMNPPATALITFTELRRAHIPVLVLGAERTGYRELGIPVIDGIITAHMHTIALRLRAAGAQTPFLVGWENRPAHANIAQGLRLAWPELEDGEVVSFFTHLGDDNSQIKELKIRLASPLPPDLLIFDNAHLFQLAMDGIPDFSSRITNGLKVVIFDDCHVIERYPDLPLVTVSSNAKLMAEKSVEAIQKLAQGIKLPRETLLPRIITWKLPGC